jgi:hypothetical protein
VVLSSWKSCKGIGQERFFKKILNERWTEEILEAIVILTE